MLCPTAIVILAFDTIEPRTNFPDELPENCHCPFIRDVGEKIAIALKISLKVFAFVHDQANSRAVILISCCHHRYKHPSLG
jgi:hypothetical protein